MSSEHPIGAIDAHFAGSLAPVDERAMRAHVATCPSCHAHYRRRLLLSTLDPAAPPAKERIARGLGLAGGGAPRALPTRVLRVGAVLALAAAVLLWFRAPTDDGFTARGDVVPEPPSKIRVYRVEDGGALAPVLGPVRRDDELAFVYENGARQERLMIFGVDEHGHVFWFHPAWTDPAEDPAAIAVARDGERHELREAIAHQLDGELLELHGLFVDRPLTVKEVEVAIGTRRAPLGALELPGSSDHVVPLTVSP